MKIAEFFAELGIRGATQTTKALGGVLGQFKELRGMSLEAKAGIFGAVVGLEELTRRSVEAAMQLHNFQGASGLSTDRLQELGYLAEINGVKVESLTNSILGLQNAQAALRLGIGIPQGAVYFGLNQNQNPEQMYQEIVRKIRALPHDEREIGNARYMASTLGFDPAMFSAARIGTQSLKGFTDQMKLSEEETQKLFSLSQEFSKFWLTVKGQTNKTLADDLAGPIASVVKTFSTAVVEVGELVKDFKKITDKLSPAEMTAIKAGFVGLGGALAIAASPITAAAAALTALALALEQIHKYTHGEKNVFEDINKFFGRKPEVVGPPKSPEQQLKEYREALFGPLYKGGKFIADASTFNAPGSFTDMLMKFAGWRSMTDMSHVASQFGPPAPNATQAGNGSTFNVFLQGGGTAQENTEALDQWWQANLAKAYFQNPAVNAQVAPSK